MNIKSTWFYAALAACLGTGFGGGMAVTQNDIDRATARMSVQCEETEATRKFRAPQPMNTKGQGH